MWMRLASTSPKPGRNVIGQRAITNVPGQRGCNITMWAAITQNGVLHHNAALGPYNTGHMLTFLDAIYRMLVPDPDQEPARFVVTWDSVRFHRAVLVQNWFATQPQFVVLYLPPYSPFLNLILLSLALESVWSPTLCPHTTSPGNGGHMWGHRGCLCPRLDMPC